MLYTKCFMFSEQGEKEVVPVAGGLDSMILAALLDQCLDPKCNLFFFTVIVFCRHF